MSLSEDYLQTDDLHPIDIVETLATHHDWEFDRVTEDQIAMSVEGQWRSYSLTLAWSPADETLRLICTFEKEPPDAHLPQLYDLWNRCNDMDRPGAFTWWSEQKLMVWRYGLCLAGGQIAGPEQIDRLIGSAVMAAERFYPAFQLSLWGDKTPAQAMQVAIAEAYGRALAARAQQAGARWLEITPTVVDVARYVPRNAGPQTEELHTPDDPRPLRIGWISTMTAMHFVRTLAAPLQLPGIHTETVAWNETGEAGEIARVDVGIMPMPDSPWERGKCGYTLMQYTACGVPVVASPVDVNRERVEPELNG